MANENEIIIRQIKLKHGTAANLNNCEDVLDKGEVVVNTTTKSIRVGNGIDKIKDLKERDVSSDGDHILTMDLKTNKDVKDAKGGLYWQIVDDGADPDTKIPGVLGYQWIRQSKVPDLFAQNYPGLIIQAARIGTTADSDPVVTDDASACKYCGGVEFTVLSNENNVYQLESSITKMSSTGPYEFTNYYEDHLGNNAQKSYQGMILFVNKNVSELDTITKVKTIFGGNTWEQWDDGSLSGVMQYVCTQHDIKISAQPTNPILSSFKGMRINMYLDGITDETQVTTYANKLYGGVWEKVDATQATNNVWQLVRNS